MNLFLFDVARWEAAVLTVEFAQGSSVVTSDGSMTMMHPTLGEAYHSRLGARREAEELYINASGYRQAILGPGPITVLDVGLGLGYNALMTIDTWLSAKPKADLRLSSLESNRALIDTLLSGRAPWQANWPDIWIQTCRLVRWQGDLCWSIDLQHPETDAHLSWRIFCVEASKMDGTHPALTWCGPLRFIWQDPFSPRSNPDLWRCEWFELLRQKADPKAVMMTYSVARTVKDSVTKSGWSYELISGAGEKRHWLRATPTSISTTGTAAD